MNILLTNDDGIYADGILILYEAVKDLGNVTVVAPDTERSAVGHAITVANPLRVKQVNRKGRPFGYATSGTPADCIKLAIMSLLKDKPDLVISGINLGPNTGYGVLYSGTVSGASEATILGVPSFAISLGTFENPDYSVAAGFAKQVAMRIRDKGLPKGVLLNVNVPALKKENIKGIKITRQSRVAFKEDFDKREDPRKHTYYWLTGELIDLQGEEDSDIRAIQDGYVSIVPIHCDMTHHGFIQDLKQWEFD